MRVSKRPNSEDFWSNLVEATLQFLRRPSFDYLGIGYVFDRAWKLVRRPAEFGSGNST